MWHYKAIDRRETDYTDYVTKLGLCVQRIGCPGSREIRRRRLQPGHQLRLEPGACGADGQKDRKGVQGQDHHYSGSASLCPKQNDQLSPGLRINSLCRM